MQAQVKEYYGKTLTGSGDLMTNACCSTEPPAYLKPILAQIHDEVAGRYYGCGLVAPTVLEGARVLDLGSGSGRDCYVLSSLVGESGRVVGVDMTAEQLQVARAHRDYHARQFGHSRSNVEFLEGDIERLGELDLEPGSFDVVVSNCVLNLCQDKGAVLRSVQRLLAPGGEMYFSDVYADRRIPPELAADPILYGECLSGALYWKDFLDLAKASGFRDPRLVEDRPITVENPDIEQRLGPIRFFSATYRLFHLDGLESACEDYGQAVIYRGTVPEQPHTFHLDGHHAIDKGRVFPVCGNTWRMLADTRFADHFDFIGDFSTHYGIFPGCGTDLPFAAEGDGSAASGGCC